MKRGLSIRERVKAAVAAAPDAPGIPLGISFYEFMRGHAKVRVQKDGRPCFVPYNSDGREPLRWVIGLIDHVLGNGTAYLPPEQRAALFGIPVASLASLVEEILSDAQIDVCGGAQFGKTILALHLKEYLAAIKGMNTYYALPDDDLVQGIVDGKERPEVLDQIPWLARMVKVGKAKSETGKSVDRKGAMLFTGGPAPAMSYTRGINAKVPTSFSADCVLQDERDDIKEYNAKFLEGRMTASGLRLNVTIGTQRYAGAGQNKNFEDGTQIVGVLRCPACGETHNPEEAWPKICRMDLGRGDADPWLTPEADFADDAGAHYAYSKTGSYYFACPACGSGLDRRAICPQVRRPERIAERRWSVRVSQLCCSGLPVTMFVAHWTSAVRDPDAMKAFCCDRLAIPRSTSQAVTPEVIARAARVETVLFSLAPAPQGRVRYAGLDTGDQCWFACREFDPATGRKSSVWAESVAAESVRARVPALCATLGVSCLFVDAGPLRDLSRDLCLMLNGIPAHLDRAPDLGGRIDFGNGVAWNGETRLWQGLRCAAVEFTGKPGTGTTQACRLTPSNETVYPVAACNRDEAIGRVIDELLTAADGMQQVGPDGKLRSEPLWLLPADTPGALPAVSLLLHHILSGSRKETTPDGREQHYIDKVENHLLLASAYAGLAESVAAGDAARGGATECEEAGEAEDDGEVLL